MGKKLITSETMPKSGCFIVLHTDGGQLSVYGEYKWDLYVLLVRGSHGEWSECFIHGLEVEFMRGCYTVITSIEVE